MNYLQLYASCVAKKATTNLKNFIDYTVRGMNFSFQPFHNDIITHLDSVINGDNHRLIISIPPGHGKTEIVSRMFPSYLFGINPKCKVIAVTWGAEVSRRINRDVQRIVTSPDYQNIFPNTKLLGSARQTTSIAKNHDYFEILDNDEIPTGGFYRNIGIGSGISGLRADYVIVDDPVKSAQDADSLVKRDRLWEWFTSDVIPRLLPQGRIVLVMTRWHLDDLVGRIKEVQIGQDNSEHREMKWNNVVYPAINQSGRALWEDRYSLEYLNGVKKTIGSRAFDCLYMQNPTGLTSSMISLEMIGRDSIAFGKISRLDVSRRIVISIDCAFKTAASNDYSVAIIALVTTRGGINFIHIIDIWRDRVTYPVLRKTIMDLWAIHSPRYILIEDTASGQSLIQDLVNDEITCLPVSNGAYSKLVRFGKVCGIIENGQLSIPVSGSWIGAFLTEILAFPHATHDDQVDALTQLLAYETKNQRSTEIFVD